MRLLLPVCVIAGLAWGVVESRQIAQRFPTVSTLPASCGVGDVTFKAGADAGLYFCAADDTWTLAGGSGEGASLPSGAIVLIATGTCPSGYTEVAGFDGKALVGTVAANKDIGGTGGSDTITPEGSNSTPTFTGDAISDVIDHTHVVDVTDPGHTHVETQASSASGGLSGWARDTSTNNAVASGYSTESATTGITASTDAPAGGVASITPTGTVSAPTFTGTQFDNRSAFVRVIACEKD